MANTKSAKKSMRQNEKRRQRNVRRKTSMKTSIKKVLLAVENADITVAQELLPVAFAKLSRAKSKGLIHRNTAARKMSRLAKRVAALQNANA
jgi:small subunit ribosomal protein S20